MSNLVIYEHRLFDLEVKEIRAILGNTVELATNELERNVPELIAEIKSVVNVETISQRTIDDAVREVDNFLEQLVIWFDYKITDRGNWEKVRVEASRHYLKSLNLKGTLLYYNKGIIRTIKSSTIVDGKRVDKDINFMGWSVISMPLYEAISETCIRIFDYSISKSAELKYRVKMSKDRDRQRILSIKSKQSVKYYFVRVLRQYDPSSAQKIIRNISIFGNDEAKALSSMNRLPSTYRRY